MLFLPLLSVLNKTLIPEAMRSRSPREQEDIARVLLILLTTDLFAIRVTQDTLLLEMKDNMVSVSFNT